MGKFRVTWFFESLQNATVGTGASLGWTESWYYDGTDSITTLTEGNHLTDYVEKRIAFMPECYRVAFARVSDVDSPRQFKIRGFVGKSGLVSQHAGAQVQCAVLADMQRMGSGDGESSHHRRFMIRALPQNLIDCNVLAIDSPHYLSLRKFLDYLGNHQTGAERIPGVTQGPWKIRYRDPNVQKIRLTRIQNDVLNRRQISVQPQMALVRGHHFEITGIDEPFHGFNRQWSGITNATIPVTGAVSVLGRSRKILPDILLEGATGVGWILDLHYLYNLVQQYVIVGLRSKRTGKVFHQLVGRSRGR